jgi:carbonic anhydrase
MLDARLADSAWDRLVRSHRNPHRAPSPVHAPTVAVIACSDARVPPSVVFDQPAGALFVARIAGNTAPATVLASIDYAVESLGVETVVVLGHTECGAIGAAIDGTCDGHLSPIVAPICELVRQHPGATADELALINVERTLAELRLHDGPAGAAIRAGSVEVRGAVHDLATGHLRQTTTPAVVNPQQLHSSSPIEEIT